MNRSRKEPAMQVREIMTEHVAYCTPDSDLHKVAEWMLECDCGAIPIVDPKTKKAVGIITDRDIVCRAVAEGQNPLDLTADVVMTKSPASVKPDTSLEDCLSRM